MKFNSEGILEEALLKPTPNIGGDLRADGIVLHDTASPLDVQGKAAHLPMLGAVNWLTNPKARASAHFVVETDGEIWQLASIKRQTWHAGRSSYKGRNNCNSFTIGIEIVNPGRLDPDTGRAWFGEHYAGSVKRKTAEHGNGRWLPYPEKQISAVTELCVAILDEVQIEFLTTHWEISPGRKIDPNPLYPVEQTRARLFGRQSPSFTGFDATTIANLNQRRWPSLNDNIIQTLPKGTGVDIIRFGEYDGMRWYLVEATGPKGLDQGWVAGPYLDIN